MSVIAPSSSPRPEKRGRNLHLAVALDRKSSAASSVPKRVLIADDHGIMREALRSLLEERTDEFECVGEAEDGAIATIMAKELHPDIVIMDIAMPNQNGIAATREIKAELPDTKVIVLHANRACVLQARQAGASAYLLKDSAFAELTVTLNAARDGEMCLSPAISEAGAIKTESEKAAQEAIFQSGRLTKREF